MKHELHKSSVLAGLLCLVYTESGKLTFSFYSFIQTPFYKQHRQVETHIHIHLYCITLVRTVHVIPKFNCITSIWKGLLVYVTYFTVVLR